MDTLKTDYKNDIFTGMRKYNKIDNVDGTMSLEDVTEYQTTGDIYAAADINATNQAVNDFYNEFEVKNTENESAFSALKEVKTATFTVSGWIGAGPYLQTIAVAGITADDSPVPGIIYPESLTETLKAQIDKSAGMITKLETVLGGVKATCAFKKPVADFTIGLKGV